jgi:hypothetical protein
VSVDARHAVAATAPLQAPDGSAVTLHGQDPRGEARALVAQLPESTADVVVIVGSGHGYVVEAARERWPAARVLVLEPSAELARAAAARAPAAFAGAQVSVLFGPEFTGADRIWRLFDGAADPVAPVLVHPVLARAFPAEIRRAGEIVRRAIAAGRMNARARRDNAGPYLMNTLGNLPLLARSPDPAALAGRFAGVPAVLVAAGPSLDRNILQIAAHHDRALLIATDTAWRPLVHAGVEPPIVVAVDPTEMNGRHLENVPFTKPTWLLAEGSVNPASLAASGAEVAFFRVGEHQPWPWLAASGIRRPHVRVWGSVLTAAFDLAIALGCDPIIFAGADLAYTGGRPYCRGTAFEEDWARHGADGVSLARIWADTLASRPRVVQCGVDGREAISGPHLVEFRDWIVARTAEHPERRFVNATGAGILTGGRIVQADLRTALAGSTWRARKAGAVIQRALTSRPAVSAVRAGLMPLLADSWTGRVPDIVRGWLEFACGSITAHEIRRALEGALRRIDKGVGTHTRRPASAGDPPAERPVFEHGLSLRGPGRSGAHTAGRTVYFDPVVLTSHGLPNSWSCAQVDAAHALVTPAGLTRSYVIGVEGSLTPGPEWPEPISGEVPHGDDGGGFAWNRRSRVLFFRAATTAPAVREEVPFEPLRPVLAPDGRTFWCGAEGGLWEWTPGIAPRQLADTPSALAVHRSGNALEIEPAVREDGRVVRALLDHRWVYDLASQQLRQKAADVRGPCSGADSLHGWTARTYPFADRVEVSAQGRPTGELVCRSPLGCAWLGSSLLVTTSTGDVLLFPDVVDAWSGV